MSIEHLPTIALAVLGGIGPALIWLWFWLKEDKNDPEPRRLILLSFITGMVVVAFVYPAERLTAGLATGTGLLILWATIEEVFKYLAAQLTILRHEERDEPIDATIYLITIALGFAAAENTLFLLNPLFEGDIISGILTGNLRFIGATLLHTLCSAVIGVAMGLSFYKPKRVKYVYRTVGVILASALHALFNFLIIDSNGGHLLTTFFFVWIGIIGLILMLERVKRIKKPRT
jgi:RsiW-degrading membrane proteinase PrsW (M82 family)